MRAPASKPTILVVDDTPDNIDLLRAVLEGEYRPRSPSMASAP
jgi:putative two-component system response regulator